MDLAKVPIVLDLIGISCIRNKPAKEEIISLFFLNKQ